MITNFYVTQKDTPQTVLEKVDEFYAKNLYENGLAEASLYLFTNFYNKHETLQKAIHSNYSVSAYYVCLEYQTGYKKHMYYFVLENEKETQVTCIKYYQYTNGLPSKVTGRCTCKEKKPCHHIAYSIFKFLETNGETTKFRTLSIREFAKYRELLNAKF